MADSRTPPPPGPPMDTGFSLSLVGVSQFPLVLQATHTYVQFPPCISKARKLNEDILPEEDGGGD